MRKKKRRRIIKPDPFEDEIALQPPKKKRKPNPPKKKKKKKRKKKRKKQKPKKDYVPTTLHPSRHEMNKAMRENMTLLSTKAKLFEKERKMLQGHTTELRRLFVQLPCDSKTENIRKEITRSLTKIDSLHNDFENNISLEKIRLKNNLYSEERITQLIDYFFGTYTNESSFSLEMEEMGADVFISKTFR